MGKLYISINIVNASGFEFTFNKYLCRTRKNNLFFFVLAVSFKKTKPKTKVPDFLSVCFHLNSRHLFQVKVETKIIFDI